MLAQPARTQRALPDGQTGMAHGRAPYACARVGLPRCLRASVLRSAGFQPPGTLSPLPIARRFCAPAPGRRRRTGRPTWRRRHARRRRLWHRAHLGLEPLSLLPLAFLHAVLRLRRQRYRPPRPKRGPWRRHCPRLSGAVADHHMLLPLLSPALRRVAGRADWLACQLSLPLGLQHPRHLRHCRRRRYPGRSDVVDCSGSGLA